MQVQTAQRLALAITPLLLGAALLGCRSGDQVITLTQPPKAVTLKQFALNSKGGIGDLIGFESPVKKDGKDFGYVMGTITKVGDLQAGSRPDREESMLTAVFDLPDGQISVLGISYYQQGENLLQIGVSMTRAVAGGTGQYLGVVGEVTITRNRDDSYTHVIRLVR